MEHLFPLLAMAGGVCVHILKKAAKLRQENKHFELKPYILDHPYQTILSFAAGVGTYLTLLATGEVTLAAAFFGGVAANSLGDIAPGNR